MVEMTKGKNDMKTFYRLHSARSYLRANGVAIQSEHLFMQLVNGRWLVQLPVEG